MNKSDKRRRTKLWHNSNADVCGKTVDYEFYNIGGITPSSFLVWQTDRVVALRAGDGQLHVEDDSPEAVREFGHRQSCFSVWATSSSKTSHCGDEVRETAGLPLVLGGLGLRSAERGACSSVLGELGRLLPDA